MSGCGTLAGGKLSEALHSGDRLAALAEKLDAMLRTVRRLSAVA